jgi:hypothetical protein
MFVVPFVVPDSILPALLFEYGGLDIAKRRAQNNPPTRHSVMVLCLTTCGAIAGGRHTNKENRCSK